MPMIFSDQMRGKYAMMVFPGIVSTGISFPFHQVLEIMTFPKVAMVNDGLDFKLFFSIDDFQGWSWKVVTILGGFFERRQEASVEHVMDGPGRR